MLEPHWVMVPAVPKLQLHAFFTAKTCQDEAGAALLVRTDKFVAVGDSKEEHGSKELHSVHGLSGAHATAPPFATLSFESRVQVSEALCKC